MTLTLCKPALLLLILSLATVATAKDFVEPDYGFSFTVDGATWTPAPIPVSTLGEPVVVLIEGVPPKSLFVGFVRTSSEPEPAGNPRLKGIEERLNRLIGVVPQGRKVSSDVVELAGQQALSFRMAGVGSGLGLGGGGDVPTVQHWYLFPRGQDLIVFQLTAPQDSFDASFARFEDIMSTVQIQPERPAVALQRTFVDEELGLKVAYPDSPWIRGGYELGNFFLPGYVVRIWSAPSETGRAGDGPSNYATRLGMFLQFPGKRYQPQELIDISIPGLTASKRSRVIEQNVSEVAGKQAMWLLVEGNSQTGSNLSGSGDVRTRQLWVAIPRTHDGVETIIVFVLNTPAADYDERLKDFLKVIETLEVAGQGV